jgi:hypothetical protein
VIPYVNNAPAHDGVGKMQRITISYFPSCRGIGVRHL